MAFPTSASHPAGPARHLSWIDAISIVLGVVIGSGIFFVPALVAQNVAGPGQLFLAWGLGGLLCLCGALTYAELATTYPHTGGEYEYLGRAYGRPAGFFFVWSRMAVIQTGAIVAAAYVFGEYLNRLVPIEQATAAVGLPGPAVYALAAVVGLSILNAAGVRAGTRAQNILTALKVLGVLTIVVAGVFFAPADGSGTRSAGAPRDGDALLSGQSAGAFGLAMVFVLYTFGGWSEAAYVAGEVRRRVDMLKVLVGGVGVLTLLYVAVNFAYLRVLGHEGLSRSDAVAADTLAAVAGPIGGRLFSVLVVISALGGTNGCIITGARAVWALGQDFTLFRPLARWDTRRNTPFNAILVQGAIAVGLLLLPNLGGWLRERLGAGFTAAVEYTAPVFWTFLLLTGVSAFVLRSRDPGRPRPFRMPGYPVVPLLFVGMCGYMLYSSLAYTQAAALVGLAVLAAGVPLYLLSAGVRPAPAARPAGTHFGGEQ